MPSLALPSMQVGDYLQTWRQQTSLTRRRSTPETLLNILLQSAQTEVPTAVHQCVPGELCTETMLPAQDHPACRALVYICVRAVARIGATCLFVSWTRKLCSKVQLAR